MCVIHLYKISSRSYYLRQVLFWVYIVSNLDSLELKAPLLATFCSCLTGTILRLGKTQTFHAESMLVITEIHLPLLTKRHLIDLSNLSKLKKYIFTASQSKKIYCFGLHCSIYENEVLNSTFFCFLYMYACNSVRFWLCNLIQ